MFASRTLVEHLARGAAAALAILTAATIHASAPGLFSMPAIVLLGCAALVLLRGCPTCWMVGLVETLHARRSPGAARAPTAGRPDPTSRHGAGA